MNLKLTQYHFDEIERLQSRIKFAEKLIGYLLYIALYALISWVLIGFFGWFMNDSWGFQEIKFCNLLLGGGCFFSSKIYAFDLFFNWFSDLSITIVIFIFDLMMVMPIFAYLNSNLNELRKINELKG